MGLDIETPRERYGNEYEAFYRLITVGDLGTLRRSWTITAWCASDSCLTRGGENWAATRGTVADARDVALRHCRERHVGSR